jgi:hypothetical protein
MTGGRCRCRRGSRGCPPRAEECPCRGRCHQCDHAHTRWPHAASAARDATHVRVSVDAPSPCACASAMRSARRSPSCVRDPHTRHTVRWRGGARGGAAAAARAAAHRVEQCRLDVRADHDPREVDVTQQPVVLQQSKGRSQAKPAACEHHRRRRKAQHRRRNAPHLEHVDEVRARAVLDRVAVQVQVDQARNFLQTALDAPVITHCRARAHGRRVRGTFRRYASVVIAS